MIDIMSEEKWLWKTESVTGKKETSLGQKKLPPAGKNC